MASLHKLLSDQGFERQIPPSRKPKKKVKFKGAQDESVALPIFICRDRRSFDAASWQRSSEKALSLKSGSRKGGSASEKSSTVTREHTGGRGEPAAIDDVAIKAVISILSGFVGQYLKDESFRHSIREKCRSCFQTEKKKTKNKNHYSDSEILARMELGIQNIERLVQTHQGNYYTKKEMDLDSLQNAIKLLKLIASLDSDTSTNGSLILSACSNLYLSIVYKIARNDKISARHLLQVFSDSPFLARTHLLPEIWEHFFLPHLLHLKIWFTKELEFLSISNYVDKEKKIEALNELYNEQMDTGTKQFALYYREWLKVGGQAPSLPSVPLPSKPSYARSRRRSLDTSTSHLSVSNKSLYKAVFGHTLKGKSMDLDNEYRALGNVWELEEEKKVCNIEDGISRVERKAMAHRRTSSQSYSAIQKPELCPESQKSDYFRFLACRTSPTELSVQGIHYDNEIVDENPYELSEMSKAIATICTSESLSDCEMAIRVVSEGMIKSPRDLTVENSLSQPSVIQGIMEVLFVSDDDEILELGISMLAELATKSEINRQCILNSDPQLEVSLTLLRSNNLFLKAAALLHQIKPKAKQMMASMEWIPLALRVLEFGDQTQTLFSVRCVPHEVAYYFLDQLLTGFEKDKNLENARQIISLGGLNLLVRRMDRGDTCEKCKAASILYYCVQADGSCRYFLSNNLNKENVVSLLVLVKESNSRGHALALLTELLCLSRRNQRIDAINGLSKGWNCLNTMQILLVYLQRARTEERSIVAVILLMLDLLMGDPSEFSIYREEAVDAIVKALDCCVLDETMQEQTARALLILGGHFSYTGEPDIEKWLLRKAGFCTDTESSFSGKDIIQYSNEEDKHTENWQIKAAIVLLLVSSGKKRILGVLSDSIANGIPCLSRASLVTVCWMSDGLNFLGDRDVQLAACSILVPQLMECLGYNRAIEERVLASFSLLSLAKGTDYFSGISPLDKEVVSRLKKLLRVTWTAKELIPLMRSR